MTDAIRKTNLPISPTTIDTSSDLTETSTKIEQSVEKTKLLRDTYEAARNDSTSAFNELTRQSSALPGMQTPDISAKVDASTVNLLNQQLLSARLGTPNLQTKIEQIKENVNRLKETADKVQATADKMESVREDLADFFDRTPADRSNAIPTRTKTSELFASQEFKPIIDDAAKAAQQRHAAETQQKIDAAKARINELEDGIKADDAKITNLEKQLAAAQAAYAKNPTKELAETIERLKKQIEAAEADIKNKEAEIHDLRDLVRQLATGERTEQNAKTPQVG